MGLDFSTQSFVSPLEAYFPTIPPLNVELGSKCNLKCPYCANPTLQRDYSQMGDDTIDLICRQAQKLGLEVVGFHGVGEPLLRKDLESILRNFGQAGVWDGAITSNCTLLSLDRMTSLRNAGLTFLYCSVDTLDPDLYRQTRGGNLQKVLTNIKNAASKFPEVQFVVGLMNHKSQVVTPATEAHFAEIFCGLDNVRCAPYENGRFPGAAEDWRRKEMRGGSFTCQAPAAYLTIDDQEKVALCCADQNTEHVLGDINTDGIAAIWYNRRNQETFRNISLGLSGCPKVCYKCVLKKSDKSLEEVDPRLHAPVYQIITEVFHALAEGNSIQARDLLRHAGNRDPRSSILQSLQESLRKQGVAPSLSYFDKYRSKSVGLNPTHCSLPSRVPMDIGLPDSIIESARAGEPNSIFQVGLALYKAQEFQRSMEWFLAASQAGSEWAHVMLGQIYYGGLGAAEKDPSTARRYFLLASEQGLGKAFTWLGKLALEGLGGNAAEYFNTAGRRGDAEGWYRLSELYREGKTVEADRLLQMAADRGYQPARERLSANAAVGAVG